MNTQDKLVIVGHASTFHDPAIAILGADAIFAEAFERHTQCKRSVNVFGLWYSWRPLVAALTELGLLPLENAEICVRTSWKLTWLHIQAAYLYKLINPVLGDLARVAHVQVLMEPLVRRQIGWIFDGITTKHHTPPHHPHYARRSTRNRITHRPTAHHLAHAANAVYTSPFEECVVMVVDGGGETVSVSFFHHKDNEFIPLSTTDHRGSLGILYGFVTELCGFDLWEGEHWKVMGLAAYGKPRQDLYDFFASRTKVEDLKVKLDFDLYGTTWMSDLEKLVGGFRTPNGPDPLRTADLAFNFQRYFTDVICALADNASKMGLSENLAYGGGCALNSSTNGVILSRSGFKRLHVPSAPADDGNALGVALYEKHYVRRQPRKAGILSPYLGSSIDCKELERTIAFRNIPNREFADESALCDAVAMILSQGSIIGWMQGRAEYGPRALGNRSILADPRPANMKDEINRRVKFREDYRPLAPAILHEFGPEYFDDYQESPYMERTLTFRPEVRTRVPAVVHEDGTGRLQTVKKEWNPRYHRLLRAFFERTGVPILLNTSFNVMGKPIAHSVADAIAVFFSTDLDFLVIDKYVLAKRGEDLAKLLDEHERHEAPHAPQVAVALGDV